MESRIEDAIQYYSDLGLHRTGSSADRKTAEWLRDETKEQCRKHGASGTVFLQPFKFTRKSSSGQSGSNFIHLPPAMGDERADARRIQGVPMVDTLKLCVDVSDARLVAVDLDSSAPLPIFTQAKTSNSPHPCVLLVRALSQIIPLMSILCCNYLLS